MVALSRWTCVLRSLLFSSLLQGFTPAAEPLRLPPGVPIVLPPNAPLPVRKAAQDLSRDLADVLGAASPLLDRAPEGAPPALVLALADSGSDLTGPEAHALRVEGSQVRLLGTDTRGLIYALYSFSEHFLDRPPWGFWAGWQPRRQPHLLLPRDTHLTWKTPQVRWRGWFPNDTDLLSPWIQRDYTAHWDRVLETMLRLKLNLLDIGEFTDDSLRKLRVPRDRGLAVTTTHLAPFGASLRNWAEFWSHQGQTPPPPLRLSDVTRLERFWAHHIRLALIENVEMIWMIGLRGDGDKGFFKTFPDAPADDASRAQVLQTMLHHQIGLLQRVTGQPEPLMRTVLYDEASDYLAAGLLHLPEHPSLIWNFSAARHDHFPGPDLRRLRLPPEQPLGYYFNVQFTHTGSHLADGEGPWKMEKNHRLLLQTGRNWQLSIVNSGNTREFPLTLSAHARMMWDFDAYESDRFLADFCARHWGPEHAPQLAQLYRAFFDAYWLQRQPDLPDFPRQYFFHDLRIIRAARDLMRAAVHPVPDSELLGDRGIGYYRIVPQDTAGTSTKVEALRLGLRQAAERFAQVAQACEDLSPRLPTQCRAFLEDSLRLQARLLAAACRGTVACAEAYLARHDLAAHQRWIAQAQAAFDELAQALEATDARPGPLQGWYAPETIFGLRETRDMIERRLSGQTRPAPRP